MTRATTASAIALVSRFTEGTKDVDNLAPAEFRTLERRLHGFAAFSERYMGKPASGLGTGWFLRQLPAVGEAPVYALGLNTALLCQHDGEQGELQVGIESLDEMALPRCPRTALRSD